jgi:hypothetical protein
MFARDFWRDVDFADFKMLTEIIPAIMKLHELKDETDRALRKADYRKVIAFCLQAEEQMARIVGWVQDQWNMMGEHEIDPPAGEEITEAIMKAFPPPAADVIGEPYTVLR